MKIEQKRIEKIAYGSFYLGVIIEVLMVIIDKSALINPIEGRLFQLTFLLFLIKTCLTRYDKKEYAVIVAFLALGAISYFVTDRNDIVRIVMFLAACKNVDMQKCMKLVFYMTLTGCLIIMFLSFFGIGGGIALTQDYGRGSVETRYTFGMGHPNALQCMVWALTVLVLYLYGEKWKWYGYTITIVINILFFLLTDSKTSLLAVLFAIVITFILTHVKSENIKKICGACCILLTMGSIFFSVLIAGMAHYVYEYDWGISRGNVQVICKKIDTLLTGRIRILTETERWEGTISTWKLFSSKMNHYYFDLGWVRLFYWYGIIPGIIIVLLLVIWQIKMFQRKKYLVLSIIMSFAVYSIFEAHIISVYIGRNYLLFLFGTWWYRLLNAGVYEEQ